MSNYYSSGNWNGGQKRMSPSPQPAPPTPPAPEPKATLRDQFAMAALTGMMANPENADCLGWEHIGVNTYEIADNMLAARGDA